MHNGIGTMWRSELEESKVVHFCGRPLGAVHKVRHAIFGQFLPPPPVTHPGTPRKYVTHLGPPDF